MDDWQLMQEYVERGSDGAFRTIVSRHLNRVHAAALRQTNDPALAEDVCQAVFMLLARKAARLTQGTVLAGWLFQTTRFVAARALRSELRRRRREQEALDMQQLSDSDDSWQRLAPLLDEGMARLREAERNAVLLRFFDDKNHREVGSALGISEEAAKKRVNRGLGKLRDFFARCGLVITSGVLASQLAAYGSTPTPPALMNTVASAALAGGSAGAVDLPILVREALEAWRWAKIRWAAGMATAGSAAVILAFLAMREPPPDSIIQPDPVPAAVIMAEPPPALLLANSTPQPPPTPSLSAPSLDSGRVLRFRVVGADTGEAVGQARLAVNTVAGGTWEQRYDLATDALGWCHVPYPENTGRLDVGIWAPGWSARFASWYVTRDDPVPMEYTLQAERMTNWVGGWLRDPEGRPVANAEIWLTFGGVGDSSSLLPARERAGFAWTAPVTKSDHAGWWSCAMIPSVHQGFYLKAIHADYAETHIASVSKPGSDDAGPRAELADLWEGRLVTRLERGQTLLGTVLDQTGRPISGAKVYRRVQQEVHVTDARGEFRLPKVGESQIELTVTADGHAPERVKFRPDTDGKLEIRLKPGGVLRLRTVDAHGRDVPEVTVVLEEWHGGRHTLGWRANSDSHGKLEWHSAPSEGFIELCALKEGFCYTRHVQLEADGREHTIVVRRQLILNGHVVDAATRQPVLHFRAIPGYGQLNEHDWHRSESRPGKDGLFTLPFSEDRLPWAVRIEAEGYETWTSEPLPTDFFGTMEIGLKRADP